MRLLSKFSLGGRRGLWVGLLILLGLAAAGYFSTQRGLGRIDGPVFVFDAVVGPAGRSVVPPANPARWQDYEGGGNSRLALLLTDPESAWLGLAHGLKSMGVPFTITRDYQVALRHRVVLVYPTISGRVLPGEALRALAQFPAAGGTLIGVNVEGGGLNELFGFNLAQPSRARRDIVLDTSQPLAKEFDDPMERVIPFSNPKSGLDAAGSLAYLGATQPLARFEDGTAAITSRRVGAGYAYAFGVDPGFMLLTGYNNRQQGVSRSYVNDYEPALDVMLRLLRNMVVQGEPSTVTISTVPHGKALTTLITHDIDFGPSLKNAVEFAEYEASVGLPATYFIQTKYVKDWNDDIFFNDKGLIPLRRIRALGMEIASHSVSHSPLYNLAPLGTGDERYPQYRPFVRDPENSENVSVLGELRISRFLLEHFLPGYRVDSFRPGHLRNPYALPQALEATGFRYSSSTTANNALTHLPFRLTYGRETKASSSIYEFPVTIEDEAKPPLGDRLPQAVTLADRLARYGGLMVVLIHTDITGHKLAFEKGLVAALRDRAWFGTLHDFAEFWRARDQVSVDVMPLGAELRVLVKAPIRVKGLALRLPAGYGVVGVEPPGMALSQPPGWVVLNDLLGDATVTLAVAK